MHVLGLVPARGGSKGVSRKNIRELAGRPLLWYTAQAALGARSLARVVLSTEDERIAEVGRSLGLEVPFLRPPELATDEAPMLPVVLHALEELERDGTGPPFDAVCLLQPTNPLRRSHDIDAAVALLERTGAESVISFVPVGERHPARMKMLDEEGRVLDPPFAERFEGQRRQELEPLYLREGSIYLTRRSVLLEQRSFQGRDCRALLVDPERACNIDAPFDLWLAGQLLAHPPVGGSPAGGADEPDGGGAAR